MYHNVPTTPNKSSEHAPSPRRDCVELRTQTTYISPSNLRFLWVCPFFRSFLPHISKLTNSPSYLTHLSNSPPNKLSQWSNTHISNSLTDKLSQLSNTTYFTFRTTEVSSKLCWVDYETSFFFLLYAFSVDQTECSNSSKGNWKSFTFLLQDSSWCPWCFPQVRLQSVTAKTPVFRKYRCISKRLNRLRNRSVHFKWKFHGNFSCGIPFWMSTLVFRVFSSRTCQRKNTLELKKSVFEKIAGLKDMKPSKSKD